MKKSVLSKLIIGATISILLIGCGCDCSNSLESHLYDTGYQAGKDAKSNSSGYTPETNWLIQKVSENEDELNADAMAHDAYVEGYYDGYHGNRDKCK